MGHFYAIKKSRLVNGLYFSEEEGFEPPVPFRTAVFKTAALGHSATLPYLMVKILLNRENNFQSN